MKKLFIILMLLVSENIIEASIACAPEREKTIFSIAAELTGCPEYIIRGIAFAESSFNACAIGDNGVSLGMFQINELFRNERIRLYGDYNPWCPLQSAILTGLLFMDNLETLGNVEDAIAAHRQGISGIKNNGRDQSYVNRVYFAMTLS